MSIGKSTGKPVKGQQRRRTAERGANIPKKEGYYWAQWRIADEGTPEGDEQTPSTSWEVVFVFENCTDIDDPEWLRASVAGQSKSQSLENFFWGPGPLVLHPSADNQSREKVAALMLRHSIATGHGDTIDDLLGELEDWIKHVRREPQP